MLIRNRRRWWLFCVSLGFCLGMMMGCQTWVPEAGVTLPSPDYLRHPPTYIPPSPPFPLPREAQTLEEAHKQYYQQQFGTR